jgi:hypothetical protein
VPIRVASTEATSNCMMFHTWSRSVVITLDNLRRRTQSPCATLDAFLVQARNFSADLWNIAVYLQDHAAINGAM